MNKILVFNGYYLPAKNYGGPLTSLQNVIESCSDEYEFYVISRNHDFGSCIPFNIKTRVWHKVGKANVMYIEKGYLDFSYKNMHSLLSTLKPALVWFAGVFVPRIKLFGCITAKSLHIPVLLSPRGEVNADHVKIKAYKKKPYLCFVSLMGFFKGCYFHSTCNDETEGIIKYFHPANNHIFCVTNVSVMKQEQQEKHFKEAGCLHAFFIARIHPIKNVLFVIERLAHCKNNINYDVYGPQEDKEYWSECEKSIKKLPSNIHVSYCGYLDQEKLSSVIQQHDCLLFATTNENYSHTIAESVANLRPVIISKGTTPWDELDGKAGFVVSLDSCKEWAEKIDYFASLNNEEFQKWIEKTSDFYDSSSLIQSAVNGHKRMFKTIIENKKE